MEEMITYPPDWTVVEDHVRDEVGPDRIDELYRMRERLYELSDSRILYRSAPSIIARSEAELFGASMPRFAFRAYFAPDCFLNLRRVVKLRANVRQTWVARRAAGANWLRLGDVVECSADPATLPPALLDRFTSCIADSVLAPPKWLIKAGYRISTAELGRAYGESAPIRGTPFMKHISMGGGLCAQAACFMATLLLHEYAEGVFGVAEITQKAAEAAHPHGSVPNELNLGGMTMPGMAGYFDRIGLHAKEYLVPLPEPDEDARASLQAMDKCANVLRSYVMSGMPVILGLDAGRMWGVGKLQSISIYERNHIRKVSDTEPKVSRRPHAVLLVGAERHNEFLLNDPGSYPFLEASITQLIDARNYQDTRDGRPDTQPLPLTGAISCLPITPREAPLGLLGVAPTHGATGVLGLLTISEKVRFQWTDALDDEAGEYRLLNPAWHTSDPDRMDRCLDHLPPAHKRHLSELLRHGEPLESWWWCQYCSCREEVWIWDASSPHPNEDDQDLERFLVGAWRKTASGFDDLRKPALAPAATAQPSVPAPLKRPRRIKPALLSSFRTHTAGRVARSWPGEASVACDFYTFMQPEVRGFLCDTSDPSAVKAMAACVPGNLGAAAPPMIEQWARRVTQHFPPGKRPIVSLASFIPSITCPGESQDESVGALTFLILFARALARLGHPVKAVEMVAGTLVEGIFQGVRDGRTRCYANRMNDTEARANLLNALRGVFTRVGVGDGKDRILVSIELEPGPLFCLRDWGTLESLCTELRADPLLRRVCGINVDLSHYALAQVKPHQVLSTMEVRQSVVHAHIAGHHRRGHLGDLPLLDLNNEAEFAPWLDMLDEIAADPPADDGPRFSGYVSLELEAAKLMAPLESSLRVLKEWLGG
jgi:hypothetical protein